MLKLKNLYHSLVNYYQILKQTKIYKNSYLQNQTKLY